MEWAELSLLALGAAGYLVGVIITRDAWMSLPPAMLIIFALMGFVVGSVVGEARRRTREGAILGLLLGPLGWLIVRLQASREREP